MSFAPQLAAPPARSRARLFTTMLASVLAAAAATALGFLLNVDLRTPVTYLSFFPAVFAATWFGRRRGGFAALGLCLPAIVYLLPPAGHFLIHHSVGTWLSLVIFVATASLIIVTTSRYQTSIAERDRLLSTLREQQHLFESVTQMAPAGMLVLDGKELRAKWANAAYLEFLEEPYRSRGIKGCLFTEFVPGAAQAGLIELYQSLARSGRSHLDPERAHAGFARGTTWWRWAVLPLAAPEPPYDLLIMLVEVTEQVRARQRAEDVARRAEAHRNELQAVIDSLIDGVLIADAQGRPIQLNRAGATMHGFESVKAAAEALSRIFEELEVHDLGGRLLAVDEWPLARAARGEAFSGVEVELRWRKPRRSVFVSVAGGPVRDPRGQPGLVVLSFRDISATRRVEEERHLLLERLKSQAAELAEADRRKDEFLAMLGHELRNPLAAIAGATYLLDRDCTAASSSAHQIISRQTQQLRRLVDDLLDIARIRHGRISLRRSRTDLREPVRRAVEAARHTADGRNHRVTLTLPDEPLWVIGDAARLQQAIGNLLLNAVKYTDPGGRIWISARADGSEVLLRVKDTGVGISPEVLPKIFDLFTQADSAAPRSQGGLGIGLALVRHLIELHGGSVEARSAGIGRGSEFVLHLPTEASELSTADSNASGDRIPVPSMTVPGHPRRIVVVEDDRDVAETLTTALGLWGHTVRVAHSGEAAVAMVSAEAPDVVLLDIGLPDIDGYEVARRLRARIAPDERPRLVALTGYGQPEDHRRALAAGFDVHLTKPVELEVLRQVVSQ